MNAQGDNEMKKEPRRLILSCIWIAVGSFFITFGLCELIQDIKDYGIIFTVWSVLLIIGVPLLVPWYLKRFKAKSVSKEAVVIFGICFVGTLIYAFLLLLFLAERNNINSRGMVVFLLFLGIAGASVLSWLISNGILALNKKELLDGEGYKALNDYLSFAFTILTFIFLALPNLDAQVDVSTFGTFCGGIICFYDLLLGLVNDIHEKRKSEPGKSKSSGNE